MKTIRTTLLLVVLGALVSLPIAHRASANPEEAARIASQSTGGRVLSVTPSNDPSRPGYYVKILFPDGRIETKLINPN